MTIRIIKANSGAELPVETFNFVDVQRQCDQIVSTAHRTADEIVRTARQEADEIRARTRQEAYESGWSEAIRNAQLDIARQSAELAEERVTAQLATALPALRAAAASLQDERDRWLIRWEKTAVRLGIAIAEKLVQRQLNMRPITASEMISEALRLAAGQLQLTVFLNPADLAAWGERAPQIVQSLTGCADATLVPDSQTTRGGCRIETLQGEIDARVESMLERIAEELVEG